MTSAYIDQNGNVVLPPGGTPIFPNPNTPATPTYESNNSPPIPPAPPASIKSDCSPERIYGRLPPNSLYECLYIFLCS